MHDTALAAGAAFFRLYAAKGQKILDVGSFDVNGTLRTVAPPDCIYTGMDITEGPAVDVVVAPGDSFPFESESFDCVVSTSCFEHDQSFWATIVEAMRVLKTGGYFYFNAPSNGTYHSYPSDNWRFYPDSGLALAKWVRRSGIDATLVESGTLLRTTTAFDDFYAVFSKGAPQIRTQYLSDELSSCRNVRHGEGDVLVETFRDFPEDMILIEQLRAQVGVLKARVGVLEAELQIWNSLPFRRLATSLIELSHQFRRRFRPGAQRESGERGRLSEGAFLP